MFKVKIFQGSHVSTLPWIFYQWNYFLLKNFWTTVLLWYVLIDNLLSKTNWVLLRNMDMYTTLLYKRKEQNGKYTGEHTMHGWLMSTVTHSLLNAKWSCASMHTVQLTSYIVHKVPMLDNCSLEFYPWNVVFKVKQVDIIISKKQALKI